LCGRAGRSGEGSATGETRVDALNRRLQIHQLLIEFADAGFNFFEIVGEALELRGHCVDTRTGVGLNILNGFLERSHGGVEFINGVGGLFDEEFLGSMILSHLRLQGLLTLEDGGDVALELDDFAGDREGGLRADHAAGEGAGTQSAREDKNVASTHEKASREQRPRDEQLSVVPIINVTGDEGRSKRDKNLGDRGVQARES